MSEFQKEVIEDIKNIAPELDKDKINKIIDSVLKNRKEYKYSIAELKLLVEEAIAIVKLVEYRENHGKVVIHNISIDKLNECYVEIISKIKLLEKKLNIKAEGIIPTWKNIGSIRGNKDFFYAGLTIEGFTFPSSLDMRFLDEIIIPRWLELGKPSVNMKNVELLELVNKTRSAISDFAKQANIKNPTYRPTYYELTKDINNNILLNGMRLTDKIISVGTNIEKLVEAIFKNKDKEFNPKEVINTTKAISNILDGTGVDKNIRKMFFSKLSNHTIFFTPIVSRYEAESKGVNLFEIDYRLENAGIPPTEGEIELIDIPF